MNANKQDAGGLPELPEPEGWTFDGGECIPCNYTADQMRAYGELCRAAPAGGDDVLAKLEARIASEKNKTRRWALICFRDSIVSGVEPDSAPAGSGEVGPQLEMVEAYVRLYTQLTGHSVVVDLLNDYAALLRKLQQGADYVMVPRELTAENGAKAALTGEVQVRLREGQPWVPVSWTAIKELHRKMVAHFDRAASQGQEGGK